jgi:hypothetical protein
MRPDVADWLARAVADAEARGLTALKPLLEMVARSTAALRDADAEFGHPAIREEADHDAA